jgi:ABC-type Fe3+-hydroxamate transport system substrate-binding protein
MTEHLDQTGREIHIDQTPKRIISCVPSQTELLYDLGLEKEVVGITGYCVHPSRWLKEKTVIGGTKDLQIERIRSLKPDLIIANREENIKEQIEELARDFQVYVSDIKSPEDTMNLVADLGRITHQQDQAESLNNDIQKALKALEDKKVEGTCLYFIWKDPYMVVSNDTFIQSMVDLTGLHNPLKESEERYPTITLDMLSKLQPDVILLSSEPYHFTTAQLHKMAQYCPESIIKIVDGEMMSWYGSRLVKGLKYVKRLREEVGLILDGRSKTEKPRTDSY